MTVRFHNLSAYKAFVISFLAKKLNETSDEKTRTLLNELIQRTDLLRTRDFYRFLKRILEIQKQTGIDLSELIPTSEEIQQIFQYPA
jgi:phage terminase Nu1 subunit (DNA packaging protein)